MLLSELLQQKNKRSKLFDNVVLIYVLLVLLYQVMYQIVPIRVFLVSTGLDKCSSALAVAGIVLFAADFFYGKMILGINFIYPLIALLGIMCISSFLNIKYGIVSNAKAIIWQVDQLLVIFTVYNRFSVKGWERICKALYWLCSSIYGVACIVSFRQFFLQQGYIVDYGTGSARQGFSEGRLYGVFASPHFAAIPAVLLIFASIYYCIKHKNNIIRIIHIVLAVVFMYFVSLSGSRSAIVAICACAMIMPPLILNKNIPQRIRGKHILIVVVNLLLVFASVLFVLATNFIAQKTSAALLKIYLDSHAHNPPIVETMPEQPTIAPTEDTAIPTEVVTVPIYEVTDPTDVATDPTEAATVPTEFETKPTLPSYEDVELERADIDYSNISNGRFRIWADYIRVTCDDLVTFLFGSSIGNYMAAIKDNYPDIYIVQFVQYNRPEMFANNYIYDTHNSIITVFATTGVLGVITLIIFLIWIAWKGLLLIIKQKMLNAEFAVLLASVLFVLATSLFDSDLFCRCTSTSIIFWWLLGLLVKSIEVNETE